MTQQPPAPQTVVIRTIHQICKADGTPYQAYDTARLWVVEGDTYDKTDGNAVTPLTTGEDYYRELAQQIASATTSIYMLGWQINWDVMLTPGLRLYDAILKAVQAQPALKVYVLPWNDSMPLDTGDDETQAVLESINKAIGTPRVFVTLATEMPAANAGMDMFYSHHQKQVVIDNQIAYMGGIDVCWGRRDNGQYLLDAAPSQHKDEDKKVKPPPDPKTDRFGNDAYNGCVPHLHKVQPGEPYVDALAVGQPDRIYIARGGSYPNEAALQARQTLQQGGVQRPQNGEMLDTSREPRMPWQDVHLRIEGPAVSDLASNFVLRWNSANSGNRLSLPPEPKSFAKKGGCCVQMLRSASTRMVAAELQSVTAAERPRVHGHYGHNHIHQAYVHLISLAEHFIYIENQFFVSAFGQPGFGDDADPDDPPKLSDEVKSATSWLKKEGSRAASGDADALPTNLINEALGLKFRGMILDVGHPSPDGKGSPFHVYITLPVHPEGLLNDPSVMTQVHFTMQTLVYGTQSLCNHIRRAIKARQLVDKGDLVDYARAFEDGNREYTEVPLDWCWAYLTLLNLRNWASIGGQPVTEQIYVHTKMMVVDDRFAIVGSANINDRSQLGSRDSELAVLVMDTNHSLQDIGSPDGVTVVRGFARDLRMKVWTKIFGAAAAALGDAIKRPAAPKSWEAIRARAERNTQGYEKSFAFIPANGHSIWPTIEMEGGKRASGLMPFDADFWKAPQHNATAANDLKDVKGYLTLMPWRWPVFVDAETNKELLQNNNSGMHSALFVENQVDPQPGLNEEKAQLSRADAKPDQGEDA